jgi:excisionase family DNA binding protein
MGSPVNFPKEKHKVTQTDRFSNPVGLLKKRLYAVPEAAEYLGRSIWAVRELVWKGSLPCVREGRRVHLDILDLDAWIQKNKSKSFL